MEQQQVLNFTVKLRIKEKFNIVVKAILIGAHKSCLKAKQFNFIFASSKFYLGQ